MEAKKDSKLIIRCGDGIIGEVSIKKYDKFVISDITKYEVEIECDNYHIWFLLDDKSSYFFEHYKLYFYDFLISSRKEKLDKLEWNRNVDFVKE